MRYRSHLVRLTNALANGIANLVRSLCWYTSCLSHYSFQGRVYFQSIERQDWTDFKPSVHGGHAFRFLKPDVLFLCNYYGNRCYRNVQTLLWLPLGVGMPQSLWLHCTPRPGRSGCFPPDTELGRGRSILPFGTNRLQPWHALLVNKSRAQQGTVFSGCHVTWASQGECCGGRQQQLLNLESSNGSLSIYFSEIIGLSSLFILKNQMALSGLENPSTESINACGITWVSIC